MRKIVLSTIALALSLIQCAAQTSFAIFVDETTYKECKKEIEAYKKVLDKEDLPTTIYHNDWTSPREVQALIREQAQSKKPIEGCVFIGDVPIVMVRGGQHMTTAFKMDEDKFPIDESSVASDRFYDDFDLEFEFIQRDNIDPTRYYYRLTGNGAQTLRPDIYSARIRVPKFMVDAGKDKYELIRKYLTKVVAAHKEDNVLDNITFFLGHGYYSDDMNIWRQKSVAYEECFPHTVATAGQHRFLHFHQKDQMKWTLMSELQREGTDLFQFSEHGAPETQYINGMPEDPTLDDVFTDLKHTVAVGRRGREYLDSLANHFSAESFTDSAKAFYAKRDSTIDFDKDLYQEDIAGIRSNAKVVILNACYNGSFHNPEGYVAGAHIFSDGDCIVAQGNTVNALQDKLEDKLIGFLSLGLRVGLWEQEVSYLENHLVGDPTYRFTPVKDEKALCKALYKDLVSSPLDVKVWKKHLKSDNALERATAVVHLGYAGETSAALDLLKTDPSPMVRMSAFSAIYSNKTTQLEEAILVAINDPYELIVRNAVKVADHYCSVGKDSVVFKACKKLQETHPEMVREQYYLRSAMSIMDEDGYYAEVVEEIKDKSAKESSRISSIRMLRNNNFIPAAWALIDIVEDDMETPLIRKNAAEALGWYTNSKERSRIVAYLETLQSSPKEIPATVLDEINKTIKRLEFK